MVGKRQMQSPKRKIPMITGPAIPAKQPRYEVKDDDVPSSVSILIYVDKIDVKNIYSHNLDTKN